MGPNKGAGGVTHPTHLARWLLHSGGEGGGLSAADLGCEKAPGMLDPRGPCPVLRVTVVSASPK